MTDPLAIVTRVTRLLEGVVTRDTATALLKKARKSARFHLVLDAAAASASRSISYRKIVVGAFLTFVELINPFYLFWFVLVNLNGQSHENKGGLLLYNNQKLFLKACAAYYNILNLI